MKKPHCLIACFTILICQLFAQEIIINPTPIEFSAHNNTLQGYLFKSTPKESTKLIVLLQGAVGEDGDFLNLGNLFSKSGFHVMTYNYPGTWRSEGVRSDVSAAKSVIPALEYARSTEFKTKYGLELNEIILCGYSYGGGIAIAAGAADTLLKQIILLFPIDFFTLANQLENSIEFRIAHQNFVDGILANPEVARGTTGKAYHKALIENKEVFNVKTLAPRLKQKHILFLGGWNDFHAQIETHLLPNFRILQSQYPKNVSIEILDTDHYFSNSNEELIELIYNWANQ